MAEPLSLLFASLRHDALWPLPVLEIDDLTFRYRRTEIQFLRNESSQVEDILQVRPMPGLEKAVFIIREGDFPVSRFTIRRLAMHFVTRPHKLAPRANFHLNQMVFLVLGSEGNLSVAHFRGTNALAALMAQLGPFPLGSCSEILKALTFEDLRRADWSLGEGNYIRYTRGRKGVKCTRSYLERNAPLMLELFDRACLIEGITQAEEDRLFHHAQSGARWAVEKIIDLNLRIVFDVAYRFCIQHSACRVPFEDVFSGGIEGLMIAIRKYEVKRGHRFASFAWQWIANKADRAFVESLWPINVPYYRWEKLEKLCRANTESSLAEGINYMPLDESDPEFDEVRFAWLVEVLTWKRVDYASGTELENISDNTSTFQLECLWRMEDLRDELSFLSTTYQQVIVMRLGMHPSSIGTKMTLEEVGSYLGITRERVRQIEKKALKLLGQNGSDELP